MDPVWDICRSTFFFKNGKCFEGRKCSGEKKEKTWKKETLAFYPSGLYNGTHSGISQGFEIR